ncbi:cell division protein SepF [Streptomyces sp. TRM 70351]|uniref:cell division protein SepF n=1 Tax=Streptomyces sp. TRM 70351 TaxID=3116552 RepID=UPI002E7B4CB7|nr:cell division protein SepF [Streptomyces sp. TRM 70351]MEE1926741.1 cell division protein SepF [Streptomyces sp. TRM 70351]
MRIPGDATEEEWDGLAEVVPLRGGHAWGSWDTVPHLPAARAARPAEDRAGDGRQLVVARVRVFADARDVAEYLMERLPVLLDLSGAEPDVARRVLDFAGGVVFGLSGSMHRVDTDVFLITPVGIEVSGR